VKNLKWKKRMHWGLRHGLTSNDITRARRIKDANTIMKTITMSSAIIVTTLVDVIHVDKLFVKITLPGQTQFIFYILNRYLLL